MGKIVGGFKRGAKSQIKFDKVEAEREREAIKKLKAWSDLFNTLNKQAIQTIIQSIN